MIYDGLTKFLRDARPIAKGVAIKRQNCLGEKVGGIPMGLKEGSDMMFYIRPYLFDWLTLGSVWRGEDELPSIVIENVLDGRELTFRVGGGLQFEAAQQLRGGGGIKRFPMIPFSSLFPLFALRWN